MAAKLESMANTQVRPRSVEAFAAGATPPAVGSIAVEAEPLADDSEYEEEGAEAKRAAVPPARGEGASPVLASSGDESQSHELPAEIVEVKLEAPATSPLTPSASSAPPPAAPPSPLTRPPARGEAGYTLLGSAHTGYELRNGDGTSFDVRIGPNYKKTGKKAPSLDAPYAVATADLLRRPNLKPDPPLEAEPGPEPSPTPTRRSKGLYDVAKQIKLPPPPDPEVANDTGLPRRLVINLILPNEQPSLTSAKVALTLTLALTLPLTLPLTPTPTLTLTLTPTPTLTLPLPLPQDRRRVLPVHCRLHREHRAAEGVAAVGRARRPALLAVGRRLCAVDRAQGAPQAALQGGAPHRPPTRTRARTLPLILTLTLRTRTLT